MRKTENSSAESIVIAVLLNLDKQILITRRAENVPQAKLWEFPGGKCGSTETTSQAIIRESKEELGITVLDFVLLGDIYHIYGIELFHFFIFHIKTYSGIVSICESQKDLRWIHLDCLKSYDFPKANTKIIDLIFKTCYHL